MAVEQVRDYIRLIPAVKESPDNSLWLTYDEEAERPLH